MKRKSKPKIFTLLGGLSKLTDILKLKFDDKILFNTSISKIEKTSDGFNLITNKEEKISCKNIISTIPYYFLLFPLFDIISTIPYYFLLSLLF